jgi:hypothetical protein
VVPLGVPHATSKADIYDGYDIPKGTTVFGNIEYVALSNRIPHLTDVVTSQCACQGPNRFRRSGDVRPFSFPHSAQPGRELEWQGRWRLHLALRFRTTRLSWHARCAPVNLYLHSTVRSGGNYCPAPLDGDSLVYLLMESIWARIFWAFDLLPAADGSTIDPTKSLNLGQTREPAPFQIRVRVRHPEAERIIEAESADADIRLTEWEY